MQEKSKYIRNLTIGAVTGGIELALIDKKPFIRDYIDTYRVTTDTTIRTTEGLTRISPTSNFLTSNEIEEINIKTINYNSVIPVGESNKANLEDTAFWIFDTAIGSFYGYLLGEITYQSEKKKLKKIK